MTRTGNGLNVVGEPLVSGKGNGTVDAVGGNMTGSNVTMATVPNHNSNYNRVVGETIILRWGRMRYNRNHNNKRLAVGTGRTPRNHNNKRPTVGTGLRSGRTLRRNHNNNN